MSRQVLLSAYEKLAALLGKLPGALQGPIMKELDPIKEVFLIQRPPRLAILGDAGIELPALVNALAGQTVLRAPLMRGPWVSVHGIGTLELADLRDTGTLSGNPADLFLFIAAASSPRLAEDAQRAAQVLASAASREGGSPPGLVVLVLGKKDDVTPVLAALAESGAASSVIFSSSLLRAGLRESFSSSERASLGDRLCDYLPPETQLEMARFLSAREAQARLAGTILKSFGAVAGIIGVQPIPLADFPVLLGLQMFMVSLIIYVSGRDFSLKLAGEFAASLSVGFGAGLAFREAARAAVRILPLWGNMISGAVAGAGTYALGRAAIAYYIEGKTVSEMRRLFHRAKKSPSALEG